MSEPFSGDVGGAFLNGAADVSPARAAFERGDFRRTRSLCEASLVDPSSSEEARAEARLLLAALRPDPLALVLGVACLLLLGLVVWLTLAKR